MYDLFYIIEVRPHWYNLIVRGTHYCISCGVDLERIKTTIYNYVRKYKTEERVYKALSRLEDKGKVSPATYDMREALYLSGVHEVFNDLVRGVVAQALKDNRQDTPYHHAKKKVRTTTHTRLVASPLPPVNEVRVVVKKVTPLKVKRTTV